MFERRIKNNKAYITCAVNDIIMQEQVLGGRGESSITV